jgi:Zn-dependent protease with chaperone function
MNTFKTGLLLTALTLLLVLGGRAIAGPNGMTLALGLAVVMNGMAYIVAPLSSDQFLTSLFSTHPPLEERIEALRDMVVTR